MDQPIHRKNKLFGHRSFFSFLKNKEYGQLLWCSKSFYRLEVTFLEVHINLVPALYCYAAKSLQIRKLNGLSVSIIKIHCAIVVQVQGSKKYPNGQLWYTFLFKLNRLNEIHSYIVFKMHNTISAFAFICGLLYMYCTSCTTIIASTIKYMSFIT